MIGRTPAGIKYKLSIGERTAENIKIELGSAFKSQGEEERKTEVKGRDLRTGLPRLITVTESEIREALKYLLELIVVLGAGKCLEMIDRITEK